MRLLEAGVDKQGNEIWRGGFNNLFNNEKSLVPSTFWKKMLLDKWLLGETIITRI